MIDGEKPLFHVITISCCVNNIFPVASYVSVISLDMDQQFQFSVSFESNINTVNGVCISDPVYTYTNIYLVFCFFFWQFY